MASVSIKTVIEQFKLTNLTPQIDVESVKIHQPDRSEEHTSELQSQR